MYAFHNGNLQFIMVSCSAIYQYGQSWADPKLAVFMGSRTEPMFFQDYLLRNKYIWINMHGEQGLMTRKWKNNQLHLPAYFCRICVLFLRQRRVGKKQTILTLIFPITAHGWLQYNWWNNKMKQSSFYILSVQTVPTLDNFLTNHISPVPELSLVSPDFTRSCIQLPSSYPND